MNEIYVSDLASLVMRLKTYSIKDEDALKLADIMANDIWEMAMWGWFQAKVTQEDIQDLLDFVAENQSEYGLVQILKDDSMPSDARVQFWYKPSYAIASMLVYFYNTYEDIFKDERNLKIFTKLLNACAGREFLDHGYEAARGKIDNLTIFVKNGIADFMDHRPHGCKIFCKQIDHDLKNLIREVVNGEQVIAPGFEDIDVTLEATEIVATLIGCKHKIFVYGTLLEGQRAHGLLKHALFYSDARLNGYAMYDLGQYPGLVEGEDADFVIGKIYFVTDDELAVIDDYEANEDLFTRTETIADFDAGETDCEVYLFNCPVPADAEKLNQWRSKVCEN